MYQRLNRPLSEAELRALNEELQDFKISKPSPIFKKDLQYYDQMAWLRARGALTKDNAVVITNYKPPVYNDDGKIVERRDCDPILYETLCDQWRQWEEWNGKREYAREQAARQYNEMAGEEVVF